MKKALFLLIIIYSITGLNVNAQKIRLFGNTTPALVIDTTSVLCMYSQRVQEDTLMPNNYKENTMVLQIGKQSSKYWDVKKYQLTSVYDEARKQGLTISQVLSQSVKSILGQWVEVIFKNYPQGKLTLEDYFCLQSYCCIEEMPVQAWQLKKDTMTVCGYLCKKAITTFRGRNYVAWYAEAIPLSDGPWKFSGLPGLILKVNDDRNQFSFECVSVEPSINKELIYVVENEFNEYVSRSEYQKVKKRCMDNPDVFSVGNPLQINKDRAPSPGKKFPYNPIELTD